MGYNILIVTSVQTYDMGSFAAQAVVLIWCFLLLVTSPHEKHP